MLRHLAQRLVVPLTIIVVAVAAFSGLYTIAGEERQMLRMMSEGADQLSRSITSATWHAMLADRREDAYQVMQTIAQKQGIDHIRIFNRNGLRGVRSPGLWAERRRRGDQLTWPSSRRLFCST